MRKLMTAAALVSTALATPAFARDGSGYFGIDVGVMKAMKSKFDFSNGTVSANNALEISHKLGYDADLVGGYDFGMFRLELEAGYKRASLRHADLDTAAAAAVGFPGGRVDASGHASVGSGMVNALFDFGNNDAFGGSIGAGFGLARVKYNTHLNPSSSLAFRDEDSAFSWQALAEVRTALSPSLDVGLKYRYFQTGKLNYGRFCQTTCGATPPFDLDGKFRSHSLLASLIYNLYSPPPPPPPAPPPPPPAPVAPATQTCADGSVILATSTCPAPPPPPPPPPVERGQRG